MTAEALSPPGERLADRVAQTAGRLRELGFETPRVGLILGTGLGGLGEALERSAEAPYEILPHFARSGVESHAGRLLGGRLGGVPVVALQGRFHAYEGHGLRDVTFPVRVLHALGARILIVSNAAGGLNPRFTTGDLMLIADHINLMGDNPLRGRNEDALGPRFPDLSRAYDAELLAVAERVAERQGLPVRRGVYAALVGPALETPAEYRFLRAAGADAVGMSTVPETIVATHVGLRVLAISVITDMCLPDTLEPVDVAKVIAVARDAEPRLTRLVEGTLAELALGRGDPDQETATASSSAGARKQPVAPGARPHVQEVGREARSTPCGKPPPGPVPPMS